MTTGGVPGSINLRWRLPAGILLFLLGWLVCFVTFMPEPYDSFKSGFIFVIVGFFGAIVGNITAIGGGLVFIPIFVFCYQFSAIVALKTSIVTQAFGMTSGGIAWSLQSRVPWKVVPWAIPGLIAGSSVSSLLIHPSPGLIKGLFGPVSIGLGVLLLLTIFCRRKVEKTWNLKAKLSLILASMIGGLLTGWVAIGEGELVAAIMMLLFGFEADESIALGVVLLSINSIYLAFLHSMFLGGLPWEIACFTILGCVIGAQVAPLLAKRTNDKVLKCLFAGIAILDGCLFVYQSLHSFGWF